MKNIDKILRKNTSKYILFVIFCVLINGKTLAMPEAITTENCKNIYLYLKNINNRDSENDHGVQLLEFLSMLCTKIYDKNLPKEEQITKDGICTMLSKPFACPNLTTKTIIPYTYSINTSSPPITCSFPPINNSKKHIATINFFLELLQKKEEEACNIMFNTLKACIQTKALQTFVKCIKKECLTHLTVASAPPLEEKQDLSIPYQPQPIQQLPPSYSEQQYCVSSAPPPTHYQTSTESHYPNTTAPPAYTEKTTDERLTSLHPTPAVVKTDGNTNIVAHELVQQILTYSKDNKRRNNNNHHKTKYPATHESVTNDISVLNIGCRSKNKNLGSHTRITFTTTHSSSPPNGKNQQKLGTEDKSKHQKPDLYTRSKFTTTHSARSNRKNTRTPCTEPTNDVISYATYPEENNAHPLYRLSVHSPDGKHTFPLVYTQAKLVDQGNEQEKGELDFFFEKVDCDPAGLWHKKEDSLKKRTYIQTIVIFAKCNDQHPDAKFIVHIKLDDLVAMRIMKTHRIRKYGLKNQVENFILASIHTTTNLKTRDNTTPEAANEVSRCFYITESECPFEDDRLRDKYSVICAKTTNSQRHPFTILPYSATVDASCNNVIGENLFNNRSNYLAITHAACMHTNWDTYRADSSLFSNPADDVDDYYHHNDDEEITRDGAIAPNQHIVGTDAAATAGRYKAINASKLTNKTNFLHHFPPVIYKIHCLDLDPNNEQDVLDALNFLEDS